MNAMATNVSMSHPGGIPDTIPTTGTTASRVPIADATSLAPTPVAPASVGGSTATTTGATSGTPVLDPSLLASLPAEARSVLASILPVFSSGDPLLMFAALSNDIQADSRETQETAVRLETSSEMNASLDRAESNERARRAARRANRMLGNAPKWVKKLITSIVIAASAAATAVTGGVAAGLAIAGAVLLIGAEAFAKAAVALGVSPENARFIALGCQIAGAALMAGAGFAGGASAASGAVETARTTAQTAQAVVTTTIETTNAAITLDQGIRTVGHAAGEFRAANATTDAHASGLEVDRARNATVAVLEDMRDTAGSYQRLLASVDEILETQSRTQGALLARMA